MQAASRTLLSTCVVCLIVYGRISNRMPMQHQGACGVLSNFNTTHAHTHVHAHVHTHRRHRIVDVLHGCYAAWLLFCTYGSDCAP